MKILFIAACGLLLFSCSKGSEEKSEETEKVKKQTDSPCESIVLTPISLETLYGCVNTKYQMNIPLQDTFTVIRNQTDFNNMVSGSCRPSAIDFTTYDLVVGKKRLHNGNRSINYTLERNCETNSIRLAVMIKNDLSATAPNITYHCLVPKLAVSEKIEVYVSVK